MSKPLPPIDEAPAAVQAEIAGVCAALDAQIPARRMDGNLLIATWNIRAFGGLTEKWAASSRDSPKRDWRGLATIAEIVRRFDVVALQEIVGDIKAFRTLMKTLGPDWHFLLTDVNTGSKGNGERSAYIFDSRRVRLSGLAGELSAPDDPQFLAALSPDHPFRQFARTPYAVSFRAGRDTFILVTAHILFGHSADDRTPELRAIGQWLADWAERSHRFHHNLLLLGDFNIDRRGDANFDAFTAAGLEVPAALHAVPRSIFGPRDGSEKFYDQIAWFTSGARRALTMEFLSAGSFDFAPLVFQASPTLTKQQMSFRISDHLPLWAEFRAS